MSKFVKFFLLSSLFVGSVPVFAASDVRYVTENLSTYLRRGAGDQYRISGSIQAGERVVVLSQKDRYSLIRDSKNREAWILTAELSTQPSSKEQNPKLQNQVQELTLKLSKLDSEWQNRVSEMQRRTKEAEQQSSELLEQNAQLKRQLETLKNKNRDLEAVLDSEKQEIVIRWFLYGGSVLGAGLLLGLILPLIIPRRRKKNGWA